MRIAVEKIKVLDGQNRDHSDKSIIQSIKKEGVLVPLLVYQDKTDPESFVLVAGHRRLASAVSFGLKDVPAEIIPEDQAERARALENLDRKGLHPMDEASEIRTLQGQGYDNKVICAMLGMDMGKLIRRSNLNNLTETTKKAFIDGKIDAAAAEEYSVMSPEDQDAVFNKFGGWSPDSKTIRSTYLGMQGIGLSRCSKNLLQLEPKCKNCPKNVASDNVLFDGTDGTCKDVCCYCEKLTRLAAAQGAEIYGESYNTDNRVRAQLQKDGIKTAKISEYSVWDGKGGDHIRKVISMNGKIGYAPMEEPKKKEAPDVSKRKKEINKEYKALFAQLPEILGKMLYEHADAWLSKNHKDERFPDKDERVVLAKALYGETKWQLDRFIYGKPYYSKSEPLEGADNKRIFSVMYLYASTEMSKTQEAWPSNPADLLPGLALLLPKSMELEDLFQLKTSKAKKKVLEIKEKLEALAAEFHKLEGK